MSIKNGLPFSDDLAINLESQKRRIALKKASLIVVSGGVGEGKTTLAVHMADYFQGSPIDFKQQYGMGGDQFQERLMVCFDKKHPVIIYDEAGDFNSRGALTKFNQQLNRIFETYRAMRILVILVLPDFSVLDGSLFKKKIVRGLVDCHSRNKSYGNYATYSLNTAFLLKHYMSKYNNPGFCFGRVTPNSRGSFKDLDPARSRELEKISIEGKRDIVSESVLGARGLVTMGQIAKKFMKSRQWAGVQVKLLKAPVEIIYKKKKYYPGEIIERIEAGMK